MRRLLIPIMILSCMASSFAQANFVAHYPGYMGRRVLLNMEMS